MSQEIILKVAPLGDAVMCLAIARALIAMGCRATMWVSKAGKALLQNEDVPLLTEESEVPEAAVVIDVVSYLKQDCHNADYDGDPQHDKLFRGGRAHLVTWMARHVSVEIERAGVELPAKLEVGPDDVVLKTSEEDRQAAMDHLRATVPEYDGSKPLVFLVAEAGSANRRIAPETLGGVADYLKERALCVLLEPLPKENEQEYRDVVPYTCSFPLTLLPAAMTLALHVVVPDTGPYHVAAAAVGGLGCDTNVVLVAGSSHPMALLYPWAFRSACVARAACSIAPCGWHGYPGQEVPESVDDLALVYKHGNTGCIYKEYARPPHLAPCMRIVAPEDVLREIGL